MSDDSTSPDVLVHAVYIERVRAQATNRPPTEAEKRLVAAAALRISGASDTRTYPGWELDVAWYVQLHALTVMSRHTSRALRVQLKNAITRLMTKGLWCPLHGCVHLR